MTPKQIAFVREYLVDKNATQAAIRAGYSAKTAEQVGYQLLQKTSVREAIDAAMKEVAGVLGITASRVMEERARIAFSDIRQIMHQDGRMKLPNELDEATAAAVVSFKMDVDGRIEYRFAGKDSSLAALEKRLGLNEKPICAALPKLEGAEDCTKAQAAIIHALASGEMLPSEANALSDLIEHQRQAYETTEIAKRLESIEAQLKKDGKL